MSGADFWLTFKREAGTIPCQDANDRTAVPCQDGSDRTADERAHEVERSVIRYVLAVVLTVTLLGIAGPAVEHGATVRSETQVQSSLAAIERESLSLLEHEEPSPPGLPGPRRVLTVEFPTDGVLEKRLVRLTIQRVSDTNRTKVTYRLAGSTNQTTYVDAPIVGHSQAQLELAGRQQLRLELTRGPSGRAVVVVSNS